MNKMRYTALLLSFVAFSSYSAPTDSVRIMASPGIPFYAHAEADSAEADAMQTPLICGGASSAVAKDNLPQCSDKQSTKVKYHLHSCEFGHSVEHVKPDVYMGEHISAPSAEESGLSDGWSIDWSRMSGFQVDKVVDGEGGFYEDSTRQLWPDRGGDLVVNWSYTDGTNSTSVKHMYNVSGSPVSQPYRIYWTDDGYNAPCVDLSDKFIKLHYNNSIYPVYEVSTNAAASPAIITSNEVEGVYLDAGGALHAHEGQQGYLLLQYFKTGAYTEQVSDDGCILVEVCQPVQRTVATDIGKMITPYGDGYVSGQTFPYVTAGLDEGYCYQHSGNNSSSPKQGWVFPLRRTDSMPWLIEVYWKAPDLMGTLWPFETDWYAADWPDDCVEYVRGNSAEWGSEVYIPDDYTATVEDYQEPPVHAFLNEDGNFYTENTNGYSLLRITTDADVDGFDNIWFLPVHSTSRIDSKFDLNHKDWDIARMILPYASSIGVLCDGVDDSFSCDDLNLNYQQSPGETSGATIEFWYKSLRRRSGRVECVFEAVSSNGLQRINLELNADNRLVIYSANADGVYANWTDAPYYAVSHDALDKLKWYHVAVKITADSLTMYLDDEKVDFRGSGVVGSLPQDIGALRFGAMNDGTHHSSMEIDEIRIWNTPLDIDVINHRKDGFIDVTTLTSKSAAQLHAYWPVEDQEGILLCDPRDSVSINATLSGCSRMEPGAVGMINRSSYNGVHNYIFESYGKCYNTNLYRTVATITQDTEDLNSNSDPWSVFSDESYIFGVNGGEDYQENRLEVWWSEAFHESDMPDEGIWFPGFVQRYQHVLPSDLPEITLASGLGSAVSGIREIGSALSFSPTSLSGVEMPSAAYISSKGFTVEMWVKQRAENPRNSVLLDLCNGSGTNNVRFYAADSSGHMGWSAAEYATDSKSWHHVETSCSLPKDQWVHVAYVQSGNSARFYTNGCELAQIWNGENVPAPMDIVRTVNFVGRAAGEDSIGLDGLIDNLRIWRFARSGDEIRREMYEINPADNYGLVLNYGFDDRAECIAHDYVGGNHGIIIGAVYHQPGTYADVGSVLPADSNAKVYVQNDKFLPGYNPNEEHAFTAQNDGGYVVYALRNDLNQAGESPPIVMVQYMETRLGGRPLMMAYSVVVTNADFPTFEYQAEAGTRLSGPHPLDLLLDCNSQGKFSNDEFVEKGNVVLSGPGWCDRKDAWWAVGAGQAELDTKIEMYKYYPMQSDFFFPINKDDETFDPLVNQPAVGTLIPWTDAVCQSDFRNTDYYNKQLPFSLSWNVSWPKSAPTMKIGETLTTAQDDLPEVWNQNSVELAWDQSRDGDGHGLNTNIASSVCLYDPIKERTVVFSGDDDFLKNSDPLGLLGFNLGGDKPTIQRRHGKIYFLDLPPDLSQRFWFDPSTGSDGTLILTGEMVDNVSGESWLHINALSSAQRENVRSLVATNNSYYTVWESAIAKFPEQALAIKPNAEAENYAVTALGESTGYFTLAMNNSTNPASGVDESDIINLYVCKVIPEFDNGFGVSLEDEINLLSEKLNVLNSIHFAGYEDSYEFEWRSALPNSDGTIPESSELYSSYSKDDGTRRITLGEEGDNLNDMVNRFFICRYRACPTAKSYNVMGDSWSEWSDPIIAEGWVQRVMNSFTPFEQRMRDVYDNQVATGIGMLQQIGRPYVGAVALNMDNMADVGLVELYQTVLNTASELSVNIGIDSSAANQQLLLAASRLADLYNVLGDEAYSDALDPTIGFGTSTSIDNQWVWGSDVGTLSTSLFSFDNQVSSLLEEELALLRGRSDSGLAPGMQSYPFYNRLIWNFTKGITAGEVAYAVNYNVTQEPLESGTINTGDLSLNEDDAALLYPQGHGDAWGHYLSALSGYYTLLRHPSFTWGDPSISQMLIGDTVTMNVDYKDEERFAKSANNLVRTGVEIVDRSYRLMYEAGQTENYAGYTDEDQTRGFGVAEWAGRSGLAALYNWSVVNSMLPAEECLLTPEPESCIYLPTSESSLTLPDDISISGAVSFESWVVDNGIASGWQPLMTLRSGSISNASDAVVFGFNCTNGVKQLALFVLQSSNLWTMASTVKAEGVLTGSNEWSHVAVSLDENGVQFYVGGVLEPSRLSYSSNLVELVDEVEMLLPAELSRPYASVAESQDWMSSFGFDVKKPVVKLSELRIWNTACSATQIAAKMGVRLYGNESGLAAYYKCNENSGTFLTDSHSGKMARMYAGEWLPELPALATADAYKEEGIRRIDRESVSELSQIASSMELLQSKMDSVDAGMTPQGMAPDAIQFDISPSEIDAGQSHFEQAYARAVTSLQNAGALLDRAQELSRKLRSQSLNATTYAKAVQSNEETFKSELISIMGYPYAEDIGTGGSYDQGYDGPDLIHYMYLDISPFYSSFDSRVDEVVLYEVPEWEGLSWTSFGVSLSNMQKPVYPIKFNTSPNGVICRPETWTTRRAEGRLQASYREFWEAYARYTGACGAYDLVEKHTDTQLHWINTSYDIRTVKRLYAETSAITKFYENCKLSKANQEIAVEEQALQEAIIKTVAAAGGSQLSTIIGTASGGDLQFMARALKIAGASTNIKAVPSLNIGLSHSMSIMKTKKAAAAAAQKYTKRIAKIDKILEMVDIAYSEFTDNHETFEKIYNLVSALNGKSVAIKYAYMDVQAAQQNYCTALAEGERILDERERFRAETASDVQQMRYQDMLFKLSRSEALENYREAFDLAQRYVYMAAKAYDYETALLTRTSESQPGSDFLADASRASSLGTLDQAGLPMLDSGHGDPGLADVLARMNSNWQVLESRLGFNNPEIETGRFSLRKELFRIPDDEDSDWIWKEKLKELWVDDLFADSRFLSHALPFANARDGLDIAEPGLIIEFSSEVNFGVNFFGNALMGGDNAYDSSHFATKIRSAGVWFKNYQPNSSYDDGLALQPRVYLMPIGLDSMRSPSDTGESVRSWQVADQVVPIPYQLGSVELDDPDFTAIANLLPVGDSYSKIRRYPSMRAYHDSGTFTDDEMISNSRLIGRSVWNSRWVLIVPAGTLHNDRAKAKQLFLEGVGPEGGIKDIKLFFKTYSYSGN